jgi:DNA ligase-1
MFKPMLAPNNDPLKDPLYFRSLRFPLLCSPKLDGIRMITKTEITHSYNFNLDIIEGSREERRVCKSRKFIDLPSKQVQELFSQYQELDGELIVGNETDFDVYNRTQSYVMSMDKPADRISFRVFDSADELHANKPFYERLEIAEKQVKGLPNIYMVEHDFVETLQELLDYEELQLTLGYEGIMMRDPMGVYKHGRGTFKEGLIYKLKRFQDDEALIIGLEEGQTNQNEDVRDNLGNAKRSTKKEGMEASGTLGRIIVDWNGMELDIAPGYLTKEEKEYWWKNPEEFVGEKFVKFRHFTHGVKDKPRFPRAVGIRNILID